MLDEISWKSWVKKNNLLDKAVAVINNIRFSPPERRVGGGSYNVSGRYPSRKMGVTIQFESHKVELPAVYEMEHDSDVLEYYDQPSKIKISYLGKNGRKNSFLYTPDYFIIRKDCAGWEEWKTEEELIELSEKHPNRYCKSEDGKWICPPGEEYAQELGLYFRVRSSKEINWIFERNMQFLDDYLRAEYLEIAEEKEEAVLSLVRKNPGITLSKLLKSIHNIQSEDIFILLVMDRIYIDLKNYLLTEPEKAEVFIDLTTASAYQKVERSRVSGSYDFSSFSMEIGKTILWDQNIWTVANLGLDKIYLLSEEGKLIELSNEVFQSLVSTGKIVLLDKDINCDSKKEITDKILEAGQEELEEANYRYNIILPCLQGVSSAQVSDKTKIASRTIRNWVYKYHEAEKVYNCGYLGLIPKSKKRGNRTRKIDEEALIIMNDFIEKNYETFKQKSKTAVYGQLVQACEEKGIIYPSYATFSAYINHRPAYEQVKKRQGRRAAYMHEPFYWELSLTTPRHGERPFEICHIDHTELDIELVCSSTGKKLGRPWVSFMVDAFSRRIIAFYLTFDSPSSRSCMMLIRECVRRFSRFPQNIVVDGGKEFDSVYFESMLARYECTKKSRPAAKARFGSVCERLFGTANTQFVHNLSGNTQIMKNVRQVTKSVNPKNHAVWTLVDLNEMLTSWAYEVYDTREHPALSQTPRETFIEGINRTGIRSCRFITYDEEFRIYTLPTTSKGTAKVEPGRGMKIRHIYYWSNSFRDPEVENESVPIRYDPFDIGTAYAYIKGKWVKCLSEQHTYLSGRSEKEIKLITEEIRKKKQLNSKQAITVNAKKIAQLLNIAEETEVILARRLKDLEAKRIFDVLEGSGKKPRSNQEEIPETSGEENKNNLSTLQVYEEL